MARTFISQPNQIFSSENFNDALATGVGLQTSSTTVESDLNSIRTQIRQILWANVTGSWYDPVTAPSGSNSARGLNTINTDLTDLEQKRFLFRVQNLNLVNVSTGSNFALLSTSLGNAPASFAAVGVTIATGSIVASLGSGSYGSHQITQVSGSSVLTPKNLVIIRDAWTGFAVTSSNGRDIYGLLQAENPVASGETFNDVNKRTQISFVNEVVTNGTSSLIPTSAGVVGGKTYTYSYTRRTALDDIPEDAYLSSNIFVDLASGGSSGGGSSATLQNVIDNQIGTVSQNQNISIRIAAPFSWTYLSGSKELWKLVSSDATDTFTVAVDRISMSSSFATTYQVGASFATGSASQIDIGLALGTIASVSSSNLILSGGSQLKLSDIYGPVSTYSGGAVPLSTGTIEWNTFSTEFGNTSSILGAFHFLSGAISGSAKPRRRFTTGVTANVAPDVNITFPTNLDATLGNYSTKVFTQDINVFLNGILLLPGTSVSSPNDVYPGTTTTSGDLKFPYRIKSGSQITMEIF